MAAGRYTRWCFTLNNYEEDFNYEEYFLKKEHKIRRLVFGKEVGEQGTPHLQGYVEFNRNVRFKHCKSVLPGAHWEVAKGTALENYEYCSKDENFKVIGEWARIVKGQSVVNQDRLAECLLALYEGDNTVKDTGLYLRNKRSLTERLSEIRTQDEKYARFLRFKDSELYEFQMEVLHSLFKQNDRQILWVYDSHGATGKTFLAHFLNSCYDYVLFDGVTSTKDISWMLPDTFSGIVFDVTRTDYNHFSYQSLEACKNGFLMSGKYSGITRMFTPVPVIVFSNFPPDVTRLSADRWDIRCWNFVTEDGKKGSKKAPLWPYKTVQETSFQEAKRKKKNHSERRVHEGANNDSVDDNFGNAEHSDQS